MAAGGRLGERQVGVGILLSNGPGHATSMKCPARWAAVGVGWAMHGAGFASQGRWRRPSNAKAPCNGQDGPGGGETFARNDIDRSSAAVEFPAGRVACLSCA